MFEFLAGVFAGALAFGSIWVWVLLLLAGISITVLVESDAGLWATIALLGTLATLNFYFHMPILDGVKQHPVQLLKWVIAYIVLGAGWGVVKWFLYVRKCLRRYCQVRDEQLAILGKKSIADVDRLTDFRSHLGWRGVSAEPPLASAHKQDLTRWMAYWPFSIVGTILNDFIRRIWHNIYEHLAKTYDRISVYVFRGVSGDADALRVKTKL